MADWELAELNIARLKAPLDSPVMADFVANLDRINALADTSEGFVWRLQTDEGDATALRPFGNDILVNLSVWRDVDALRNYVFHSAHTPFLGRRREWFERMGEAYVVLWWVPCGQRPTLAEAHARLLALRAHGPRPDAFTMAQPFPAPVSAAVGA